MQIKVSHTAPTFKQFEEWGIQQAFPTFYIYIKFYDNHSSEILSFTIKITGHYYCSGSRNFEIDKTVLDHYNIHNFTKEQLTELFDQNVDNIIDHIQDGIKGSMIDDPSGIAEVLWDQF
jgi:hypothetical protein